MRGRATTLCVRALVEAHGDFVWRTFRRMGFQEAVADDAVQQVFLIAFQRLSTIQAGREKAFLYSAAMNVASRIRYGEGRRRETLYAEAEIADDFEPADESSLDDLVEQHRARAMLDEILGAMPEDLRAVLVLVEVEEMMVPEVAECLGIPTGTVASRLRRARSLFDEISERVWLRSLPRSKR